LMVSPGLNAGLSDLSCVASMSFILSIGASPS
jgi:hypothetical protein